jgi:hypothetical protein
MSWETAKVVARHFVAAGVSPAIFHHVASRNCIPRVSGRRITATFWFFEKFEFGESAESSEATYLRACSVRFVFFECEFESCGASASAEELFL